MAAPCLPACLTKLEEGPRQARPRRAQGEKAAPGRRVGALLVLAVRCGLKDDVAAAGRPAGWAGRVAEWDWRESRGVNT